MSKDFLNSISPIDGRYHLKTKELQKYFSEASLIKYRVKVEIEYFISLIELPLKELKKFDISKFKKLRSYYKNFNIEDAKKVKDLELITNHDKRVIFFQP